MLCLVTHRLTQDSLSETDQTDLVDPALARCRGPELILKSSIIVPVTPELRLDAFGEHAMSGSEGACTTALAITLCCICVDSHLKQSVSQNCRSRSSQVDNDDWPDTRSSSSSALSGSTLHTAETKLIGAVWAVTACSCCKATF